MTSSPPSKTVWPTLVYRDAPAAIAFLVDVLNFEDVLVVPDEQPDIVEHAQLR